jgi:hypothetical protein
MRIIVDVDDVLADTFRAIEDRFGKAADVTGEDLRLYFPDADVKSIIHDVAFNMAIPPLFGAAVGVRWLLEAGHSARYLSSRPAALEAPTREWLQRWQFPDIPLQCVGREGKQEALRSDPYDLLIDDMLSYLTIARDRGKRAIAFTNPWNTGWNDLEVVGWREIKDVLQAL